MLGLDELRGRVIVVPGIENELIAVDLVADVDAGIGFAARQRADFDVGVVARPPVGEYPLTVRAAVLVQRLRKHRP